MVQTKAGAAKNPWIAHLKGCAKVYQAEKPKGTYRRRLNQKSPPEALHAKPKAPQPAAEPPKPPEPPKLPAPKAAPAAPLPPARRVASGALEAPPRPAISREDAAPLMPFAVTGREYLRKHPEGRATAARFARELATRGDLKEALKLAKLPTKTAIASFVKAFPDFRVDVPPNGGTAYVSLRK